MNPFKNDWITKVKSLTALVSACVALCAGPWSGTAIAQSEGGAKPMAIIALSGYDSLLEDINFIGSLSGQEALGQNVEQMIMLFTQNKGLVGLEKDKPVGLMVQSDGMNFSGALCIPVSSLEELTTTLAPFGVTAKDQGDGITQIATSGQTLFARESNGWALVSMMPQMLENLPEDPGQYFDSLTEEYDLGIQVNVQNIPEPFRQMAVQQLQAGMESGMQKLPDESDEQYEARKELSAAQIEQLQRAINEIDELTIGLALDGEQQRAYFDFAYTAVPNTQLADQLAENSDPKTNFAGFFQPDAAMMMSFAGKVTEADMAQAEQMFAALRKQIKTAIDEESDLPSDEARDVLKSAADDFMDALKATLQAGVMDGGAVLNMAPSSVTLVAGGFVGDPGKFESGLKKLAELAKDEPKFPGINWDADSHADIRFHTLSIPIPEIEEQHREIFGEAIEVAVGIGKDSAYFALGRNCLEAVKGIIDDSAASPQKSVPPMEMTFSLGQIMEFAATVAEEEAQPMIEMISNMLASEANGRDHVRIVTQPIPNGARTRIEIEEGALRSIGMAVQQAQMQGSGAGF
ncbi:MAG: hypothetical protein KDA57_04150 [Planctomycetales bacterium]|nr:hypothetical protein [Planctomycetales bacterium]